MPRRTCLELIWYINIFNYLGMDLFKTFMYLRIHKLYSCIFLKQIPRFQDLRFSFQRKKLKLLFNKPSLENQEKYIISKSTECFSTLQNLQHFTNYNCTTTLKEWETNYCVLKEKRPETNTTENDSSLKDKLEFSSSNWDNTMKTLSK